MRFIFIICTRYLLYQTIYLRDGLCRVRGPNGVMLHGGPSGDRQAGSYGLPVVPSWPLSDLSAQRKKRGSRMANRSLSGSRASCWGAGDDSRKAKASTAAICRARWALGICWTSKSSISSSKTRRKKPQPLNSKS